jgi:hypothetical protein
MILVIGPLVKGDSRQRMWTVQVATYVVTLIATAAASGAVLAFIGAQLFNRLPAAFGALAVLTVLLALVEVGLLRWHLPQRHWQMPRDWLRHRGFGYPVMFGATIGVGVLTRAPFASFHAMLAWQAVMGSMGLGALMGMAYGVARASAPIISAHLSDGLGTALVQSTWWVVQRERVWHLLNGISLALAAGAIVRALLV